MSSKLKAKNEKKPDRRGGLSSWEKIAIPIILILVIWGAYSFSQPSGVASVSQTSSTPAPIPTATSTPVSTRTATATPVQTTAPDFTLPVVDANGLTGQRATLSAFRGKVVLMEFMEPWCPHCQNMAPVLESLYKQYGSQNVVFISIAGPWQGATSGDTARFIQTYGSSWTYFYDSSGTTMSAYGVTATPTFFIIGKDGSIFTTLQGEQSYDTLANALIQVSG